MSSRLERYSDSNRSQELDPVGDTVAVMVAVTPSLRQRA
jgi:hypothetical protein